MIEYLINNENLKAITIIILVIGALLKFIRENYDFIINRIKVDYNKKINSLKESLNDVNQDNKL